jgi:hypothetical protein
VSKKVNSKENKRLGTRSSKSRTLVQASKAAAPSDAAALLADLRGLIESARQRIATVANASTTILCWNVGRLLLRESLQDGRGAYGRRILATVSQELSAEFGVGFSYAALTRMVRFAEWMTDERIVSTLSTQLSWSCFSSMPNPSASASTSRSCRRCRSSAPGCTKPSNTRGSRRPDGFQAPRNSHERRRPANDPHSCR